MVDILERLMFEVPQGMSLTSSLDSSMPFMIQLGQYLRLLMKYRISAVSNIGRCIFEMFMPKDWRLHNLNILTVKEQEVFIVL